MTFSSELYIFLASSVLILALFIAARKSVVDPTGRAFLLMLLFALAWTAGYMAELSSPDYYVKILTTRIQTSASLILPVIWLNLILRHFYREKYGKQIRLLYIFPLLNLIYVWLVPLPNLFWGEPALVEGLAPILLMDYDYGPLFYYVQMPYTYIMIALSIAVLVANMLSNHALYRSQSASMLVAILLPSVSGLVYVLGYSPIRYMNYTSAVFSLSCLMLFWALYRYRFLDLIPKARQIIVENMEDGIIVADSTRRIIDINPAAARIIGVSGSCIGTGINDKSEYPIIARLSEMLDKTEKRGDIACPAADGSGERVYEIRYSRISDRKGVSDGGLFTISDFTEKADMFNRIYEQSIRDELTGSYNRRYLFEKGNRELERIRRQPDGRISVMVIDVDKMKTVNDIYGHSVGDSLLKEFSAACNRHIRSADLFGRIGGDEFAVILPDTCIKEAAAVARRIIEHTNMITVQADGDTRIRVEVSIGALCAKVGTEDIGVLIKAADTLMYEAKRNGGNRLALDEGNCAEKAGGS